MPAPSSASLSSHSDEEIEDGSQPSAQDGSQPKLGLQPLGKSKQGMLWKKVEVSTNVVNVKGGFSAQYHTAPSITCTVMQENHVFVKLCKNEAWFLKGVGGMNTKKGDLKVVNVINQLRIASSKAEMDDEDAAVAESEPDDDDPMLALDQLAEIKLAGAPSAQTHAQGPAKPKAKGRPKLSAKGKAKPPSRAGVQTFSMPKHPACSGWDAHVEGGKLDIHVYRKN